MQKSMILASQTDFSSLTLLLLFKPIHPLKKPLAEFIKFIRDVYELGQFFLASFWDRIISKS